MADRFDLNISKPRPDLRSLLFAGFWITGLISGTAISLSSGEPIISMTQSAASGRGSVISLLATVLLPFLFAAFAASIHIPALIFAVGFGKAFSFSFVSMGCMQSFPGSGWLIRWLLCFSNAAALPVLFWFCCSCLHDKPPKPERLIFFASLLLLTATADYVYISSFLSELMHF